MTKRLPHYPILGLAVLCIVSAPAALPQVKGAVVQTWNYDPTHNPPLVTVKIVNNSHKDITAFNISIKETYANGRVEEHETLEELVGKIIAAQELQGGHTKGAELFRKLYGDGAFHPGEARDEKFPVQAGLTNYQAVIDVVTYFDGTAEATNNDALGRIIEERQSTVASQKIVVETIQAALADANDSDPSVTAARKLQDRAAIWKAQQHIKLDLDVVRLESMADELKIVSSRSVNKRDTLKHIANREATRLSMMSIHAALVKTGAAVGSTSGAGRVAYDVFFVTQSNSTASTKSMNCPVPKRRTLSSTKTAGFSR